MLLVLGADSFFSSGNLGSKVAIQTLFEGLQLQADGLFRLLDLPLFTQASGQLTHALLVGVERLEFLLDGSFLLFAVGISLYGREVGVAKQAVASHCVDALWRNDALALLTVLRHFCGDDGGMIRLFLLQVIADILNGDGHRDLGMFCLILRLHVFFQIGLLAGKALPLQLYLFGNAAQRHWQRAGS